MKPFTYGDPAPKTWGEAASIIKAAISNKPKRKSSGFMDRLAALEAQLKDKK